MNRQSILNCGPLHNHCTKECKLSLCYMLTVHVIVVLHALCFQHISPNLHKSPSVGLPSLVQHRGRRGTKIGMFSSWSHKLVIWVHGHIPCTGLYLDLAQHFLGLLHSWYSCTQNSRISHECTATSLQ